MSIAIGGISVPDSKLAREIAKLVRDTESPLLFHHSSRVFYWGALTGVRRGVTFPRRWRVPWWRIWRVPWRRIPPGIWEVPRPRVPRPRIWKVPRRRIFSGWDIRKDMGGIIILTMATTTANPAPRRFGTTATTPRAITHT